jgi:hypothetical protein
MILSLLPFTLKQVGTSFVRQKITEILTFNIGQ